MGSKDEEGMVCGADGGERICKDLAGFSNLESLLERYEVSPYREVTLPVFFLEASRYQLK